MGTLTSWFEVNPVAGLLIILMILDITSGIIRASQERALSSNISGKGMRRKAMQLILILTAEALERFVGNTPVSEFTAAAFCISEGMSIIENAKLMGVKIPAVLTNAFGHLDTGSKNADHQARPDIVEQTLTDIERDGF